MHAVPPPNVHALLPPLFACLQTAFVAARPPPALLPLLAPILRQRVQLLAASDSHKNWLTLLTWRPDRAQRLVTVLSDLRLEAHPVSGELELFSDDPDAATPTYRRPDEESLQARCDIRQHGVAVLWTWCVGDNGKTGLDVLAAAEPDDDAKGAKAEDGWRVAEVLPLEDEDGNPVAADGWQASLQEAEAAYARAQQRSPSITRAAGLSQKSPNLTVSNDDDDDYWARYDSTPGPTSAKPSPLPRTNGNGNSSSNGFDYNKASISEMDYYAQYSNVQPAMDAHDPDEEPLAEDAQSTLQEVPLAIRTLHDVQNGVAPADSDDQRKLHSPSPTRPGSAGSSVAAQLEQTLVAHNSPAEAGVKQHISYELKSLFRLAQRTGIERAEFERLVRLELDTLDVLDL